MLFSFDEILNAIVLFIIVGSIVIVAMRAIGWVIATAGICVLASVMGGGTMMICAAGCCTGALGTYRLFQYD